MRALFLLSILHAGALGGCPEPKSPQGCGGDLHPPPAPKDAATLLALDADNSCPRAAPRVDGACELPRLAATDSQGASVDAWVSCEYLRPDRGRCAYDACTCMRTKAGALVWQCGPVSE